MVAQASAPLVVLLRCPPSLAPPWPWRRPCSCGLSHTGFSPGSTWPCLGMHWGRCECPTLLKPELGCSSVRQCMSAALDVEVQASSLVVAWTREEIIGIQQDLVFGKDEGAQQNPAISKEITLPEAEDVDQQVEISQEGGCAVPPFVPYTATVPWHTGTRNLFSRFFPRYGNYCGPNYSSGRESGSLHWDKPPTDWLDHCCYRHDMGYDTLDQAKLHEADKEFLKCLQTIPESATISAVGQTYRSLYTVGLERFLLPYRDILVKKIEEGKRGRETAPETIVEEVKERNVGMNRTS